MNITPTVNDVNINNSLFLNLKDKKDVKQGTAFQRHVEWNIKEKEI